jgi:ABC-type Fe3+ transport system permease subunit
MLWNTSLIQCLFYSCLVCGGAAVLATILSVILALLTECLRVPLGRILSASVLGLILVPVYVQATAWSAGFGVQGWFRLSQVAAATSPVRAVLSVVWIHGAASMPLCFLLCCLGLRRSMDAGVRQAIVDFGPMFAMTRVLVPKIGPWIAAGFVITVAVTGNDMVVTNLFQLPTLTETVYQQVQFGELRWAAIAIACAFSGLLSALVLMGVWKGIPRLQSEGSELPNVSMDSLQARGPWKWFGMLIAIAIAGVVVWLPLANLLVKAGWQARDMNGVLQRSWSPGHAMSSFQQLVHFSGEFGWSLQLAFFASCLAVALGLGTVWMFDRAADACSNLATRQGSVRILSSWMLAIMAFLLSLPGPVVNLIVLRTLAISNSDWCVYLADRTLVGPIVALQSRCLPLAVVVLWIAMQRFRNRHATALSMDRGLGWASRVWILRKAMHKPFLVAWVLCFFVSFADLSSYLLVQPPGVTTVAMRMFDLLHYGVKNQEAALALLLAVVSMVAAWGLLLRPKAT